MIFNWFYLQRADFHNRSHRCTEVLHAWSPVTRICNEQRVRIVFIHLSAHGQTLVTSTTQLYMQDQISLWVTQTHGSWAAIVTSLNPAQKSPDWYRHEYVVGTLPHYSKKHKCWGWSPEMLSLSRQSQKTLPEALGQFQSGFFVVVVFFCQGGHMIHNATKSNFGVSFDILWVFFLPPAYSVWSTWGGICSCVHSRTLSTVPRTLYCLIILSALVRGSWRCLKVVLYPLPLTWISIISLWAPQTALSFVFCAPCSVWCT